MTFPLIFIALMSHNISVSELGVFFICQSSAYWLSLLFDFGMIRHGVILVNSGRLNNYNEVFYVQIVLFISIVLFTSLLNGYFELFENKNVFFVISYAFLNSAIPRWAFQAKGKIFLLTKIESISRVVCLCVIFLINPSELYTYQLSLLGQLSFVYVLSLIVFRSNMKFKVKMAHSLGCFCDSKLVFLSRCFGGLALHGNTLLIGGVLSPTHAAIYATCEKVVKALTSVTASIGEATYPMFVTTMNKKLYRELLIISSTIPILLSIISAFILPTIMEYCFNFDVIYADLLYVMLISVVFYTLSSSISLVKLVATLKYRDELATQVVFGSVSVIFSILLLNVHGIYGAAVSYALASVLSFLVILSKTKGEL
ncbi:lipopolysaccharide biosynthesis protein [Vibrio splendidus]|uniref:lipopolysaccharide biosynthesis protein n=1 Tax=Vibrio splendidus TaxID=29497 RepID=UPI0010557E49|nr:hypothetical protein [Vibrio splendidus]